MLPRDTPLRTLLCEDVAARYAAADSAVPCEDVAERYAAAHVAMLLRDALLRTLLCEEVAARYAAVRMLLRETLLRNCWVRMLLRETVLRTVLLRGVEVADCKAEGQTHLGRVSTLHEDVGVQLPGSEKELRTLLSTCCFRMLRLLSGIELQCNEQIRGPDFGPLIFCV